MSLPWPDRPPRHGRVVLRAFTMDDVAMVRDLATDEYVPLVGTLPANAGDDEARAWIERQRGRHVEGIGWSFCIADAQDGAALGQVGLWPKDDGRAHVGYGVAPAARGRHAAADALAAVVRLARCNGLARLEAYVEPWNVPSLLTAQRCGFEREGLLRAHQTIGGIRRDMVLLSSVLGQSRGERG